MLEPPTACPGCGLLLPAVDGPTHPYIGASPACWALYGEVLAREYSQPGLLRAVHRVTVDSYAVQHPGARGRREARSVALHLAALALVLEHGILPEHARTPLARLERRLGDPEWLDPPVRRGRLTVADVQAATSAEEHAARVQGWAREVWQAWDAHHARVREWVAQALAD